MTYDRDHILALEEWDEKARALAEKFGLRCSPQDFEIGDYEQMIACVAYSGMPSHYPHWSYGKACEKLRTLYDYGVSGLPYEMVINSDPAIAYLMKDNTELLQVLTMAHVYGHNDFFKNNANFRFTRPDLVVEIFKTHADRVRGYIEDPSIGLEKVERILDSAHSLSFQCRRNLAVRKLVRKEQEEALREKFVKPFDEYESRGLHRRPEFDEAGYERARAKHPIEPDEDILLFIRDNNHRLTGWERDLLTIVHEEAQYFIPQIDTKIMNEGWASFWHKRILEALDLPQGMRLEFMVRHSHVVSMVPGQLNPYFLGIKTWEDIEHRYNEAYRGKICDEHKDEYDCNGCAGDLGKKTGQQKLFEVRESERDSSFIRNFLGETLIRELHLFEYQQQSSGAYEVTKVADSEDWKDIRETLARNVGMGSIPVIKVEDADYNGQRMLLLKHYHDGRDLYLEYAQKTLQYIKQLWFPFNVALETVLDDQRHLLELSHSGDLIRKPLR